MRSALIVLVSGLLFVGCGGSTSRDDASGGSGNVGAGGSGATGNVGGGGSGGSGNVGGGGSGGSGNVGGGSGGSGNVGGGGTSACCTSDNDCPTYFDGEDEPWPAAQCVNGVCKEAPPPGLCWSDTDCSGLPGSCIGGQVCPCGLDCFAGDQLGKCSVGPGCCAKDSDCPQTQGNPTMCVSGNCEPVPPPGKCWTDQQCPNGSACSGGCICPCGALCACGGQMGACEGAPPPPAPACCKTHAECGPGNVCSNTVCKAPAKPYCWADVECPAGQKCVGASVCPCLAFCAVADSPGKCQ